MAGDREHHVQKPPVERCEPLPEYLPKPPEEDPEAPERLRRLLAEPTYLRADQDLAFLERNGLRGLRLQLEYEKAERLQHDRGVRATIVIFGGTRIIEEKAARRRLEAARELAAASPDDPVAARSLRMAERVLAKSHYYEVARELGRIVGRSGKGPKDNTLLVVTGGGPGVMEAGNRGAYDVGADSIGLNVTLPHEQFPNPYITPELCFQFRYFALRKMHFLMRARAMVAFPGGYGTLDELFETLCLIQTRKIKPMPVVLVGESFWRGVVDVELLAAEGTIAPEDLELFRYAETAEEIWTFIQDWYEDSDEDLFDANVP